MSTRGRTITLATRGSDLARHQAETVKSALKDRRVSVELVEVQTRGDEIRDELIHRLGTTGAFVRALDEKVLDGSVDAAVHSMKDVPTDQPADLVIAGVPERASPGDVLVSPKGHDLDSLPQGATVGTSSLRRQAQLLAARPDLDVDPLRGNVDTRVEKLLAPHLQREYQRRLDAAGANGDEPETDAAAVAEFERTPEQWIAALTDIEQSALERDMSTEFDAIVLAAAGLERVGLLPDLEYTRLDVTTMVPAPGQGTLAVTARADSDVADLCQDVLDHPPTRVTSTVERTVLSELGGGCVAPVGIYARLRGEVVATVVRVLSREGTEDVRARRELPVETHPDAAVEFAADLADEGATALIETARRDEPDAAKRGE